MLPLGLHLGLTAAYSGSPPPAGPTELPAVDGVSNFVAANFPVTLAKLADLKAGTDDLKVMWLGDSTSFGAQGDDAGMEPYEGARQRSPAVKTAAALVALSVPASGDGYIGNGNVIDATTYALADDRIANSGFVTTFAGDAAEALICPGGYPLYTASGADSTSTLIYTPDTAATHRTVFYIRSTTGGTMDIRRGGSSVGTINTAGAYSTEAATIALGAAGVGPVTLKSLGDGSVFEVGSIFHNTGARAILCVNAGASSWSANEWINVTFGLGWEPLLNYWRLGMDLVFVNLTINQQSDQSGMIAGLTSIVDKLLLEGHDVVLVSPQPTNFGGVNDAAQASNRAAVLSLATTKGVAFIDLAHNYSTWAAWNGAGLASPGGNNAHPNDDGYDEIASFYTAVLKALYDFA